MDRNCLEKENEDEKMTTEEIEILKTILTEIRKCNENLEALRKEIKIEFESLASDVRSVI
jgi:hypothetical protein